MVDPLAVSQLSITPGIFFIPGSRLKTKPNLENAKLMAEGRGQVS
jgi:hypothetical protein